LENLQPPTCMTELREDLPNSLSLISKNCKFTVSKDVAIAGEKLFMKAFTNGKN